MDNSLFFLQWNCQSIQNKRLELEKRGEEFDVIMLSETWLSPNDRFILKNFDIVRCDRRDRRGDGTAILIRNGIKYKSVETRYTASDKLCKS